MLRYELRPIPSLQVGTVVIGRSVGGLIGQSVGRPAGRQFSRQAGTEGGKEQWMEVFCEHYNIAHAVQPVLLSHQRVGRLSM